MYILIIDEGCCGRKEEVYAFPTAIRARAEVERYICRTSFAEDFDVVDAKLYRSSRSGKCRLVDQFSNVALRDGYAEGWESEGRREEQSRQWEAEREAERRWRAEFVAIPIERHPD